jgi:hypothetical protein
MILEAVLKDKERELKLYQKFESLTRFFEAEVFPSTRVPLQRHIEELKGFVERLIPDPMDRREEMFSGEVFILLCTLYFHDLGVAGGYGWSASKGLLDHMESTPRTILLNREAGRRLDIPEEAVDLVNSLIFSVKKIPLEWEITENTRKAIVRNGRMLGEIFNFAHLLWDIFSPNAGHAVLRRQPGSDLRLLLADSSMEIDPKSGVISIRCRSEVPYQAHVLRRTRVFVEAMFRRFTEAVNGRLGFQYRQIEWDIEEAADDLSPSPPGFLSSGGLENAPFARWSEASLVLDKLFRYGHVIVVGDETTGKTTLINSFVVPQLRHMSQNVFYAEIWDRPVHTIRTAIEGQASILPPGGEVDIVSTCKSLLANGSLFLIIDGCERIMTVAPEELEKLERLVDFCIENENTYLVALGDKERFFDWYKPFRKTTLSAVYELSHPGPDGSGRAEGEEQGSGETMDANIDAVCKATSENRVVNEVIGVLAGETEATLKRYRLSDIFADTYVSGAEIGRALDVLEERGVVRRHSLSDSTYYALISRHVRDRLCERLDLSQALAKRKLRKVFADTAAGGGLLTAEALDATESFRDRIVYTEKERGLIIASMISLGRDSTPLLDRLQRQLGSFDCEPVLALLAVDDARVRERALRVLSRVRDENIVNPMLAHVQRESEPNLRGLIVDDFIAAGKRRAIVALVQTLSDIGDTEGKARVLRKIGELPARRARELLITIADAEKDPETIDRIDGMLARLEE